MREAPLPCFYRSCGLDHRVRFKSRGLPWLALLAGCASTPSFEGRAVPPLARPIVTKSGAATSSVGTPSVGTPSVTAPSADPKEWGEGSGKSYWIAAADVVGFEFLLNQFDRYIYEPDGEFDTDWDSIEDNLHRGWVVDRDGFAVNQVGHPYQGSMVHGFARSAGLDYWHALVYDAFGSALWEIAGETSPPSLNDQITTTFGGSFLGEALFRMASLILEHASGEPGCWREISATAVSPATGFNRLAFANRFDGIFPSRDAPVFLRAGAGVRDNTSLTDFEELNDLSSGVALVNFGMDYGMPGQSGYEYERPFDYFHFETTLTSSSNVIPENVEARGLLCGTDYEWGDDYRGIWGLYGTYDYIAPEAFSVSSSALSFGTTAQYWLADSFALQGNLLGGVGWTALGNIADVQEDRDYHSGWGPQALAELRFLVSDVALLELGGREYFVHGSGSGSDSREEVLRGEAALTVRIWRGHALTVQFVASNRDASFVELPDTLQSVGALSLLYTYLGDRRFGAVDWAR